MRLVDRYTKGVTFRDWPIDAKAFWFVSCVFVVTFVGRVAVSDWVMAFNDGCKLVTLLSVTHILICHEHRRGPDRPLIDTDPGGQDQGESIR